MVRRLALVAALTLTACTTQPDTPTPAPTPAATVVPLTVAQATKAALTLADWPRGWEGGVAPDPSPDPHNGATYDPEDCWTVRDPLRDRGNPATVIVGQFFLRAYSPSDDLAASEVIASWTTPQVDLVRRIADMLPHCAISTITWYGSETYKSSARELAVPGLKDGIALRIAAAGNPRSRSVTYLAYVARGGTLMTLNAGNDTFPTDRAFAQFVTKAVARLDAVS